jgi:hypothetical protein
MEPAEEMKPTSKKHVSCRTPETYDIYEGSFGVELEIPKRLSRRPASRSCVQEWNNSKPGYAGWVAEEC